MVIAIIFLLFVSFFFSGSETALTAANKMRLQTKANSGDEKSGKLLRLVSKPSQFITTILIGNNIANILLPTLVTTLAIQYGFNVGIASAILTIVIIVFSEVIPKSVAAAFPERIAFLVFPIINFFILIFKPITFLLNKLTSFLTRALSKGEVENASISKAELRSIVDIASSEGMLQKEESYRIKGVLDFQNLNVKDVLKTPRTEVVALSSEASYQEVKDVVIDNPFTRYPIYDGDIDNVVGIFHSKFLIQWSIAPEKPLSAFSDLAPLIVHEFHSTEWVFRQMTKKRKHLAIVLDEYGGTEGILSHEDIIETIIGLEIEDEIDLEKDAMIDKFSEKEIICDGKITLHYLNSIFLTNIPEEEDVLSGYLLNEFEYFPEEGEVIERGNLTFEILEMERRMISKVRISKKDYQ